MLLLRFRFLWEEPLKVHRFVKFYSRIAIQASDCCWSPMCFCDLINLIHFFLIGAELLLNWHVELVQVWMSRHRVCATPIQLVFIHSSFKEVLGSSWIPSHRAGSVHIRLVWGCDASLAKCSSSSYMSSWSRFSMVEAIKRELRHLCGSSPWFKSQSVLTSWKLGMKINAL